GATSFGGDVNLASLDATAPTIQLSNVTTSGAQTYHGAATLGGLYTSNGFTVNGATTLANDTGITNNGGNGSILLHGPIDGAHNLNIGANFATATLGPAGATTPLTSITAFIQSIQLQSVSTTGDQFYHGPATIAANGNIFSDHGMIQFSQLTLSGTNAATP